MNNTVSIEYPFNNTELSNSDGIHIQFCLPTDSMPQSLYPCLLGCLYCLRTGQVFIIEVLTGQFIGKLEFAPTPPNQPPCPQSLISIGNTDLHNLFIFLTCQFGLFALTPCTMDMHSVNNNTTTTNNNYANELSNTSAVDMDQISLTGSEISLNKTTTMMNKSRSCITSSSAISSQTLKKSELDFSILLHTIDNQRLKVNIVFTTSDTYVITLNNNNESPDKPIQLSVEDRLFVGLSEVARVFWMGFKEQTLNYLKCILHDQNVWKYFPSVYFRLIQRLLNEHPVNDARWQWLTGQLSVSIDSIPMRHLHYLESEGPSNFQYILPKNSSNNNINPNYDRFGSSDNFLLLPMARLNARLDALHNLQELWLLIYQLCCGGSSSSSSSNHHEQWNQSIDDINALSSVKLIDLPKYLNILLSMPSKLSNNNYTTNNNTSSSSSNNQYKNIKSQKHVMNISHVLLCHEVRNLMHEQAFINNIEACNHDENDDVIINKHKRHRYHEEEEEEEYINDNNNNVVHNVMLMMNTFPDSKYACCSIEHDQCIEEQTSQLCQLLDIDCLLKLADDDNGNGGNCAETHILYGLHMASELVEFAKALQMKLAKEPQSLYQSIFNEVTKNAGFTLNYLQVIKSQDIVLQTVTLIPQLVKTFCETIDTQMSKITTTVSTSSSLSEENDHVSSDILSAKNSVELLIHISRLIEAGIAEIVRYRETHLPKLFELIESCSSASSSSSSYAMNNHQLNRKVYYLPCWLTDEEPYGIGNVLLKLLNHLVKVGSNKVLLSNEHDGVDQTSSSSSDQFTSNHQLINDCIQYAIDLIRSILSLAKQRVLWAIEHSTWAWCPTNKQSSLYDDEDDDDDNVDSDNDLQIHRSRLLHKSNNKTRLQVLQRLRRLKHWYANLREYLISIVGDQLRRPESALDLAEQFIDRDQIMRWCYLLEVQDEQYSLNVVDNNIVGDHDDNDDVLSTNEMIDQRNRSHHHHHHRLAAIIKRIPPEWKLPDYALQWFLSHGERARVQSLLALLHRSNNSLNKPINSTTILHDAATAKTITTTTTTPHRNISSIQQTTTTTDNYHHHHHLTKPNSSSQHNSHLFDKSQSMLDVNLNNANNAASLSMKLTNNDNNNNNNDPVEKFLHRKDVQNYAWPHLLSTGQYEKASTILYDEACKEFQYLGRRKTLFSLAKLTYLTTTTTTTTRNHLNSLMTTDQQSLSESIFTTTNTNNHEQQQLGARRYVGEEEEEEDDDKRKEKQDSFLLKINAYLDWISLQELIDLNHTKSESTFDNNNNNNKTLSDVDCNARYKRVLSIPVLIRLSVNYAVSLNETLNKMHHPNGVDDTDNDDVDDVDVDVDEPMSNGNNVKQHYLSEMIMHFRRAFMLIDILEILLDLRPISSNNNTTGDADDDDCHNPMNVRDELLLHIWCQAIRMDEWSTAGDIHDPIQICTQSFICALVSNLYKNGVDVISLLPSPEQLFAADELIDLVKNPQFHYLIESGFEHMRNLLLTKQNSTSSIQDVLMTDLCV
ncbi:unnamed protein product [Schistosoma turkestanicum]|nr:unnamed protein product [Schistosoma turkestanicum]